MPVGPGKYDRECQAALRTTHAAAVLLIVLDGDRGGGFSLSLDMARPDMLALDVPRLLRSTADQIEKSYPRG